MGKKKTYYDWLLGETKKEKEIRKKLDAEIKAFEQTDAYKEHDRRVNELYEEMKQANKERIAEAEKHRPNRKSEAKREFDHEAFKKAQEEKKQTRMDTYSDNLKNLIEGYDKLSDAEKKVFQTETAVNYETYPKYENPQTTEKEMSELLEILVQECINFINERGLKDVDVISFSADSLQTSAKYDKWVPATDAGITMLGWQKAKSSNGKDFDVYKEIGHYM